MIVAVAILAASVLLLIAPGMSARAAAVDGQGDPLPPGAVLRLGNVRFLHNGTPHALAFSPDGNRLATAAGDHGIHLWDTSSGKEIGQLGGDRGRVSALVFCRGGKTLASGGEDGVIRLWDTRTGKEVGRLVGHKEAVRGLALSPDGAHLASGSNDGPVRLWDVATGKELAQSPGDQPGSSLFYFFPDGKRLAIASAENGIVIWDPKRPKAQRPLVPAARGVADFALSPDGRTLVTPARDSRLVFWDVGSGKKLGEAAGPASEVYNFVFSPDSALLVSWGFQGDLVWWDAAARKVIRDKEEAKIYTAAFSPDSKMLAVGSWDGRVRLWDVKTGKQRHPWPGHVQAVHSVAFAPDGWRLASGGMDGTALVWDLAAWLRGPGPLPERLSPARQEELWSQLGDADPARAYRAVAMLAAMPAEAVPPLKERLRLLLSELEKKRRALPQLLADLDNDRFEERQKASAELEKLGWWAEPSLQQALADKPSLEARRRLESILQKLSPGAVPGDALLVLRSLQVLEQAGSAEAVKLLRELTERLGDERLRCEARASLRRLGR